MNQADERESALRAQLAALTGELVNSQDQLLALMELGRSMRHHVALAPGMDEVARATARILKMPAAGIILELADRPRLTAWHPGATAGAAPIPEALLSELLEAIRGGGSEVLRQDPDDGGGLLALPVRIRDDFAGALVCQGAVGRQLGARERKIGRAIADQAGAHLESILLVEENLARARLQTELDLARTVQSALLPPKAPEMAGLDLWAAASPARQVGGDGFDYLTTADGVLYLSVSDVSGKGMPAALMMTTLRTTIRNAMRFGDTLSPAVVLRQCNDALFDDFTDVGMFATLFIGRYEPGSDALHFANAGHSPVIYRPAHGEAQLLKAADIPIGVLPGGDNRDEAVTIRPGDLLLVGTDGLPEANNAAGELYGYDRLLDLVDALAHLPAAELGPALLASVNDFARGEPQADDQTLMVIKGVAR